MTNSGIIHTAAIILVFIAVFCLVLHYRSKALAKAN